MANLKLASWIFSSSIKEMFIWESHICAHICAPVLAQSLIQKWNNSPDYIFHWVVQYSLTILSSIKFVQIISQGHQMTGGAECFMAKGMNVLWLGLLSALCLGALSVLCLGALCILWAHPWLFFLIVIIPIFLMFLFILAKMGQCGPHEHFSATCSNITIAWGIVATLGGASVFTVGADVHVSVRGIGQSFLVSNKFLC